MSGKSDSQLISHARRHAVNFEGAASVLAKTLSLTILGPAGGRGGADATSKVPRLRSLVR